MNDNGNAFAALLTETKDILDGSELVTYYGSPLPSPLDERLAGIVRRFLGETAVHQTQFQEALTPSQRALFGAFGHRVATLAARQNDADLLKLGLVGTAIANYTIPESRRVAVSLAVFYHVARQLGLNPIGLFNEVAKIASVPMQQEFQGFGRDGRISLSHFGWRERKTEQGIKFERT